MSGHTGRHDPHGRRKFDSEWNSVILLSRWKGWCGSFLLFFFFLFLSLPAAFPSLFVFLRVFLHFTISGPVPAKRKNKRVSVPLSLFLFATPCNGSCLMLLGIPDFPSILFLSGGPVPTILPPFHIAPTRFSMKFLYEPVLHFGKVW